MVQLVLYKTSDGELVICVAQVYILYTSSLELSDEIELLYHDYVSFNRLSDQLTILHLIGCVLIFLLLYMCKRPYTIPLTFILSTSCNNIKFKNKLVQFMIAIS